MGGQELPLMQVKHGAFTQKYVTFCIFLVTIKTGNFS